MGTLDATRLQVVRKGDRVRRSSAPLGPLGEVKRTSARGAWVRWGGQDRDVYVRCEWLIVEQRPRRTVVDGVIREGQNSPIATRHPE